MPFLAQWNTIVLYPPSLIWILLPLPWSLNLFCLVHLFAGGLGMYLLARERVSESFAAAFAGILFILGGVTISSLVWPHSLAALAWMPWLVRWAGKAAHEGGRATLVAAVIASLQMLTGSPEIILLTWMFVLGDAGLHAGGAGGRGEEIRRLARALGAVALWTAGLCAAQLLPFFELLARSQRDVAYSTGRWDLPIWGVANFFAPLVHNFTTPQGLLEHGGQGYIPSYYFGLGALALAFVAVWKVRSARVALLAGALVFGVLLAFGDNAFLYPALRGVVPLLGVVRYPVKGLFLAVLALPLLSAHGLDWCLRRGPGELALLRRTLGVSVGLVGAGTILSLSLLRWQPSPFDQPSLTIPNTVQRLVLLAAFGAGLILATRREAGGSREAWLAGVLLIAVIDLATHHPGLSPAVAPSLLEAGRAASRPALSPSPSPGISRVFLSREAEHDLLFSRTPGLVEDFTNKRLSLWSNLHLLEGIPKVTGTSALVLRGSAEVTRLPSAAGPGGSGGLLDLLAVSHVLSPGAPPAWKPRAEFLPWASAGQAPRFATEEEALREVSGPTFDPRSAVYLPLEARLQVTAQGTARATVSVTRFAAGDRELQVNAEAPAMLVLSESWFPPWRATVDGSPVALFRANHGFMAVQVPEGSHLVRLVYRDLLFDAGAIVSLLSLIGFALRWRRGFAPA